jgi:branched-chain amino acid transport system substrate-binding protein
MKGASDLKGVVRAAVIGSILFFFLPWQLAFGQKPINIGFTTDFSGVCASFGIQEGPVVEMVVKQVNDSGGINGRPIKLFVLDNASDPAKAIANVKMFKDLNKCSAIVQGVTSTVSLAVRAWAEENQIPVIAPDPASDQLWQKSGKAWLFRTEVPTSLRILAALPRLKKLGYTKVSFEGSTLAWGTDALKELKKNAGAYGIEVVGEVLVEPKTKDLTIQATRLRQSGASAVVVAEYEAESGVWARAMKGIGWKPFVYHGSPAVYASTLGMYSADLFEGWEVVQTIDTTKPLVQEVWKKYETYTGKRYEDEKGPRTWDAINLIIEALRKCGNPDDPTAIRDALYKLDDYERAVGRKGSKGGFATGRNHLVEVGDMVPYVTKSGKLVPVEQ